MIWKGARKHRSSRPHTSRSVSCPKHLELWLRLANQQPTVDNRFPHVDHLISFWRQGQPSEVNHTGTLTGHFNKCQWLYLYCSKHLGTGAGTDGTGTDAARARYRDSTCRNRRQIFRDSSVDIDLINAAIDAADKDVGIVNSQPRTAPWMVDDLRGRLYRPIHL